MLIRGGRIHTMTAQGCFVGDILVRNGIVAAVGTNLTAPEGACVLEAQGLTVLPGLIDAYIQDSPDTGEGFLSCDQSSGVTAGLLWPEEEGTCHILSSEPVRASSIYVVDPSRYTDAQLHDRFLSLASEGYRIACRICSANACRRVLQIVHSTRVKAILLHLANCDELLEAVKISGCPVIMGVSSSRAGSPWAMACRLDELGVTVSVTCSYPSAKLRHLPLCAALCVREHMDRERALHTVTTAPAGLLGLQNAGRIETGCRADFVIYDGDPLLLATSHVMTIAGGKIRH